MNSKQAKITSRNCKQQLQARSEFKTRQIMKLPNQKAKVPFFYFFLTETNLWLSLRLVKICVCDQLETMTTDHTWETLLEELRLGWISLTGPVFVFADALAPSFDAAAFSGPRLWRLPAKAIIIWSSLLSINMYDKTLIINPLV